MVDSATLLEPACRLATLVLFHEVPGCQRSIWAQQCWADLDSGHRGAVDLQELPLAYALKHVRPNALSLASNTHRGHEPDVMRFFAFGGKKHIGVAHARSQQLRDCSDF
ncbi:hypothetical protein OPT61_g10018 [Boeremia exigua]|uniref:Uncharacterized protein n=1 Tax=Boeremia exigua TaxID=749465 RepID=A0ACC2HSL6_9PLEO|nr:hypothetical protein OPT61_g10018 [Boeremia exigua]